MLRIHFIDDSDGQPLCSTPESDRWLWTVNPRTVTCPECAGKLASGERRKSSTSTAAPPSDGTARSA
jgi:hypothetical protein